MSSAWPAARDEMVHVGLARGASLELDEESARRWFEGPSPYAAIRTPAASNRPSPAERAPSSIVALPAVARGCHQGHTQLMLLLALAAAGIGVVIYAWVSPSPRVIVIASVLGGVAGLELMLFNAARQGITSLSESGAFIRVLDVTLVPVVWALLGAAALVGALVAVVGVLAYREARATWSRETSTN